jgi:hypothetical protein
LILPISFSVMIMASQSRAELSRRGYLVKG